MRNYQVYSLNRRTGQALRLTDGKSRNLLEAVHPDGNRIAIASNLRNGKDTDLYIANPQKAGSLKCILETKDEFWTVEDWSSDDFTLLINRYVSINETYPALLDIVSGEKRLIPIPGDKKAAFGAMKFSPDGKLAYVASDANGEFQQLAVIELRNLSLPMADRGHSLERERDRNQSGNRRQIHGGLYRQRKRGQRFVFAVRRPE